jgi:ATP-dependent protease ClpP protease subunit
MKTIRLDGEISPWGVSAAWLAEQIGEEDDDITLVVNSGGGSIIEGFAIYNLLKDYKGKIYAKVDFAASMASVVVMAADKITMRGNSSLMMIHKPWSAEVGTADDLRKTADMLDKLEAQLTGIYMTRAAGKLKPKELEKMLADETWMSGDEAKKYGFADEIEKDAPKNLLKTALVAMHSQEKIHFDMSKLAAKIEEIEQDRPSFAQILENCVKLCDIEDAIRARFGASQTEATAIVAAVKKLHGDRVGEIAPGALTDVFNRFEFTGAK